MKKVIVVLLTVPFFILGALWGLVCIGFTLGRNFTNLFISEL